MASDNYARSIEEVPCACAHEVASITTASADKSRKTCEYVLEHILMHEAAAQQLQVSACLKASFRACLRLFCLLLTGAYPHM
jgi:hypothetical protein